ncbi:MAG: 4Fe-4S binding protein [Synergistaceae bacterium]
MAKNFKIDINNTWCKSCGLCIALCPKKVLELDEKVKCVAVRQEDCIGCLQCENICPDMSITVQEVTSDE